MMERNFGFQSRPASTSALAAPWFAGAALGLDVLETFYVDQQPFLVGKLSVSAGGGLQGLAMQDLSTRTRSSRFAAAASSNIRLVEAHDSRAGDEAFLLGPYDELVGVLRRDQPSRDG